MNNWVKKELSEEALGVLGDIIELNVEEDLPTSPSSVVVERPLLPSHTDLRRPELEITTTATLIEEETGKEEPSEEQSQPSYQPQLDEVRAYLADLIAKTRTVELPVVVEKTEPQPRQIPKIPERTPLVKKDTGRSATWLDHVDRKALNRFEKKHTRESAKRHIYDAA